MIGSTNGTATTYDLTDAEGSVLTSLSSSAVLGEQIYGPYGNQRYTQGTMGTDKGYTGQFQDAATGLDYYNARYYDPVMGQFLSADNVQGNAQGFDPYSYAGENPETATDPTGQRISCPPDCGTPTGDPSGPPCAVNSHGCSGDPTVSSGGGGTQCHGTGGRNTAGAMAYTTQTIPEDPCSSGFKPGKGGCVYDDGQCHDRTIQGCNQYRQKIRDGQTKAYNDAQQAGRTFNYIAITLTALAALFAFIGFGAGAVQNWLLAGIMAGLALGFGLLAEKAAIISGMFSGSGASTGTSLNVNVDWFTKANLKAEGGDILAEAAGHDFADILARLFACYDLPTLFPGKKTTYYELSSSTQVITWMSINSSSSPFAFWKPLLPNDEYYQRIQALCDLVITRTGLELHDLSQSLEEE